jgi:ABC-2 type transport system permease protein
VGNGDEPAAVLIRNGRQVRLVYAKTSQSEAPIVIGIVRGIVDDFNLRAAHAKPTAALRAEPVESQSVDYVDLLVPGLLALAIAQSAAFGVAFSLVAWRQKGMLRRLRLTPLPLVEFATGRIIFHLLIALVQTVILLTVGRVLFGVHLVGNVLALVPLILVGSVSFIALGMCIGGRANTEDATAALSNLIVLPMTFLGGVFFPLSAAPAPIRAIAHFLPLTYLAGGLQDVAVRGHSFTSTLPNLGALAIFAALLAALALRLFRWQTVT